MLEPYHTFICVPKKQTCVLYDIVSCFMYLLPSIPHISLHATGYVQHSSTNVLLCRLADNSLAKKNAQIRLSRLRALFPDATVVFPVFVKQTHWW